MKVNNEGIQPVEERLKISYNPNFSAILDKLKCSLAISTYQAGRLIFISPKDPYTLKQTPVKFKKPMGIALMDNLMAVATLDEIQIYASSSGLADKFPDLEGELDKLYLPRATYFCGITDLHDISFAKNGIWAVNTEFSCISSYNIEYNFIPRWKPPFIKKIKPGDLCHLNGMAVENKTPVYTTALGKTTSRQDWRENITNGGILMKTPSGDILAEKLAMPHSPRIVDGKLLLLQSATGQLTQIDRDTGELNILADFNAFVRGMCHKEGYLFIGISKLRKSSKTFEKLSFENSENKAGLIIFDLKQMAEVGRLYYETEVEEIFDVQLIEGSISPGLLNTRDERHRLGISTPHNSFWRKKK